MCIIYIVYVLYVYNYVNKMKENDKQYNNKIVHILFNLFPSAGFFILFFKILFIIYLFIYFYSLEFLFFLYVTLYPDGNVTPLPSLPFIHCLPMVRVFQAIEEEVKKLKEDADILSKPQFSSDMEERIKEVTQSAVERVQKTLDLLNTNYQELTTMCQQKRDLFIVCVKFHMTTKQVGVAGRRGW